MEYLILFVLLIFLRHLIYWPIYMVWSQREVWNFNIRCMVDKTWAKAVWEHIVIRKSRSLDFIKLTRRLTGITYILYKAIRKFKNPCISYSEARGRFDPIYKIFERRPYYHQKKTPSEFHWDIYRLTNIFRIKSNIGIEVHKFRIWWLEKIWSDFD